MRQWFVSTTKHQQETTAAANLREQGYGVYLPKRYWRHLDGRRIEPLCSLRFTGYLFVEFGPGEHGPILNTRGIDELLLNGNKDPQPLPLAYVGVLREIEDQEYALASTRSKFKPRDDLHPGDKVRIDTRDHLLNGYEGFLIGVVRGEARVLVGNRTWPVPEIDLKKIETKKRAA